jgi:hypothetical protein
LDAGRLPEVLLAVDVAAAFRDGAVRPTRLGLPTDANVSSLWWETADTLLVGVARDGLSLLRCDLTGAPCERVATPTVAGAPADGLF